ncbi:MAG: MBL fold metallo-hydrolase [Candidatus Meridianibacter frigidus]|nr:MAG: MBL fold metallo-hydrolase [Candidatus Eremiobacteraeota bacterium]
MIVQHLQLGPLACNCTILADETTKEAIVVDGGDGVDQVVETMRSLGLRTKYLAHTHAHIDHIGDLGRLREETAASALLHRADFALYQTLPLQAQWVGYAKAPPVVKIDADLQDGDRLHIGNIELHVLHTPGHTPGSVCFEFSEAGRTTILSGDTLFAGSIGRWDLGGTSMEDIVASIHRKLMDFSDDSTVVPGHGPFTTIGIERRSNPYLAIR